MTRSLGKETTDDYEAFIGEGLETFVSKNLRCLYKRVMSDEERMRYGWSREVDGVLYISPKTLEENFGTFRIHSEKDTFVFNRRKCKIDQIEYLEEFFGTCIAVRIAISSLKGEYVGEEIDTKTIAEPLSLDLVDYVSMGDTLEVPYIAQYKPIVVNPNPSILKVEVKDTILELTGLSEGTVFLKILIPKTAEHGASRTIVKQISVNADFSHLEIN